MKKIYFFATERPLTFASMITVVFILMVLISSILVGAFWSGDTVGWYVSSTIGRIISILLLLGGLGRL